jgi:diaminopimelate epimerase
LEEIVELRIETGRGVLTLGLGIINRRVEQVAVDMGEPILLPAQIPVKVTGQQAVGIPLAVENQHLLMTCVSMGNPHAVFYCSDVSAINLEHLGPLLENHPLFPERVNVHFVQRISGSEVIMRTWERGSGITLACGTGAAAVCVAGVLASKTEPAILAHLPGGDLRLQWNQQDNHVYKIGPAVEVFSGDWPD